MNISLYRILLWSGNGNGSELRNHTLDMRATGTHPVTEHKTSNLTSHPVTLPCHRPMRRRPSPELALRGARPAHSCPWSPSRGGRAPSMAPTAHACTQPASRRAPPSCCAATTATSTCTWSHAGPTASYDFSSTSASACSHRSCGWRLRRCCALSMRVCASSYASSTNSRSSCCSWDIAGWTSASWTRSSYTACTSPCSWWEDSVGASWSLWICRQIEKKNAKSNIYATSITRRM